MKKDFSLFITSDFLAQFGAGIIISALNWYVIALYGSNSMVAVIANVNVVAGLLISLSAIYFLRLVNSKMIVIISYIFRIFFIIVPIIMLKLHSFGQVTVYLVALSNGIGWNLYFPASKDILNAFTKDTNVIKVNSLAEISMQMGLFSSGLISGILYRCIGFEKILFLGVCLFGVSLILFILISHVKLNVKRNSASDIKIGNYWVYTFWYG
ncbi:hypothetical protein [Ligilactobacillus faecis]|uniref:hypothetical protein n=1 Tax=Ligilactobacillus faecis TaxID=762833 RepID=UPI002468FFBB|nr:hypothetical protein [Ligilactobacillus faecis]WGN89474.1 hypothetical protein QFX10_10630 [Ligilactobacillus faecis]